MGKHRTVSVSQKWRCLCIQSLNDLSLTPLIEHQECTFEKMWRIQLLSSTTIELSKPQNWPRTNVWCLVENSVQDMTTGDHIGGYSMLRHSPGPVFGCRSVGSLAANLTTQFMELEGPRYHYRPLFSIATERVVCTRVCCDVKSNKWS